MKFLQQKNLQIDFFFLFSGIGSILVGTILAKPRFLSVNYLCLLASILFFIAIYLLQGYVTQLKKPTIIENTRLQMGSQNIKPIRYIPAFGLLAIIFASLYLLLKEQVLIGINLIWLVLISILILGLSNTSRFDISAFHWFVKAIVVSPLVLILGISVQAIPLEKMHFFFAAPLFFLASASFIALEFPVYAKAPSENKNTLIPVIGLGKTIALHTILILFAFISLGIFVYVSGTFRSNWILFLISLISFSEMFLLNRILLGMKPNFDLLKTTAYLQTLTFLYLFILNAVR